MAFGDIVLLKDRSAHGPYTRAQIQEGLSRGEFTARDLAHTPGLKDWLPLLEVLHHLDRETVHLPRPREHRILPPLPYAPPESAVIIDDASHEFPARFSPPTFTTIEEEAASTMPPLPQVPVSGLPPQRPPREEDALDSAVSAGLSRPPTLPQAAPAVPGRTPAPMRRRFLAWAIDWAVLFVPVLAVFGFAYLLWAIRGPLEHRDPETARQEEALLWRNLRELLFMVAIGFSWVYAAGLESSRGQGTIGKRIMGLVVTDEAGQRLGFLRATGRHAAKYLSAVPLFLGFIMALFNPQRLTWHDRLAGTRVVER